MDKRLAGLLGAVAGMATMGAAHAAVPTAATSAIPQASSYAELLAPVPNSTELLQADDQSRAEQGWAGGVQLAQYHHHHHHHRVIIRRHHHHHHHVIVIKRRHHHHHHHHGY